ncbi:MAG: VanZ family protein [Firmicutes bacterium]|nr:VanZ family protein [Bacillota bacterium]NLO65465.1 VanZ family protein [Bacillota bacterium]
MDLFRWLVVIIYVLAIFIFAGDEISSSTFTAELLAKLLPHLGRAEIREYVVLVRKAGHFLAYGLLTLLVYRAAAKTKGMQRYALPGAAFFALMVAVADESYQQFLVHRTGVWTDVLIDGSGVAVTVLGIVLYGKLRRKTSMEVREDAQD